MINWGTWQPEAPPGINSLRLIYLYVCVGVHIWIHTCICMTVCLCLDMWVALLPRGAYYRSRITSYTGNQQHAHMCPHTRPTWNNHTNTPLCCAVLPDAGGAASNWRTARPAAGWTPTEPPVPAEEEVQWLPGAGPQSAGGRAGGPAGGHGPIRQQQPLAGSHWRQVCVCMFVRA